MSKPTPSELALIEDFVNTVDKETGEEELGTPEALTAWLSVHGLSEATFTHDDLARAAALREDLHGIPISLKDIIDQQGVPTTAASRVRGYQPAPSDALVTSRLKAAGAVLVGKTNLHEFAFGTTSGVSAFGAVRNPIDRVAKRGRISGGSAVSVVSGMCDRHNRHGHRRIDPRAGRGLRHRRPEAGVRRGPARRRGSAQLDVRSRAGPWRDRSPTPQRCTASSRGARCARLPSGR